MPKALAFPKYPLTKNGDLSFCHFLVKELANIPATFASRIIRNMLKPNLICLFLLISTVAVAQQRALFNQNMYNMLNFNPAYAGYQVQPEVIISARNSFMNVEGSPRSVAAMFHGRVLNPKVGLGIALNSDKVGVQQRSSIVGSYSYSLVSENKNAYTNWGYVPKALTFGISAGVMQLTENLRELNVQGDPKFEENIQLVSPIVGAGILYSRDPFYMGLSCPQILFVSGEKNINFQSHIYFNAGTYLSVTAFNKIHLSSLLKYTSGAPVQAEFNAHLIFKSRFKIGGGYRSYSAINVMTAFRFKKNFELAYFYDTPLKHVAFNFNAHEVMFKYNFLK